VRPRLELMASTVATDVIKEKGGTGIRIEYG